MTVSRRPPRWLVASHRWLGLTVGLLVLLWCVSGAVMMYVGFPELTESERWAGLDGLRGPDREVPVELAPGALPREVASATDGTIERLCGALVLRSVDGDGSHRLVRLGPGAPVPLATPLPVELMECAARTHRRNTGGSRHVETSGLVDLDQWTVAGRFRRHRPLLRVRFDDDAGTDLYVSSVTGEVVQRTTAAQRRWNAAGAVSHWLYLTALRRHPVLWGQVVIWSSVAALLLLVGGAWLGVSALRRARPSPFRGLLAWHHISGTLAGAVLFTWTLSGLLSMNPWGLLEGSGAAREVERLRWVAPSGAPSPPPSLGETAPAVLATVQAPATGAGGADRELVSVEIEPFAGRAAALAHRRDGSLRRLDGRGADAPLAAPQLRDSLALLRAGDEPASIEWLDTPDAYHYPHHGEVVLPAVRVTYDDDQRTRYYVDPATGHLLRKVDRDRRLYRWLHLGLHRLDFAAIRQRPLWDLVVLLLLAGSVLVAVTGTVFGARRQLRRARRHRTEGSPPADGAPG